MDPIKCPEPGCTLYISDPCGKASSLLSFKFELESRLKLGDTSPLLKKALEEITFKISRQESKKEHVKKLSTLILVCGNGHKHTYQLNCN